MILVHTLYAKSFVKRVTTSVSLMSTSRKSGGRENSDKRDFSVKGSEDIEIESESENDGDDRIGSGNGFLMEWHRKGG
jgi:hypothetical protein